MDTRENPHKFLRDLSINIPTRILPPVNAGNFAEALLRAVRLEAQYCYLPPSFSRRLHLKMDRVFPRPEKGNLPEGDFLLFLFWVKFSGESAGTQLWEGTIFFSSFLERVES